MAPELRLGIRTETTLSVRPLTTDNPLGDSLVRLYTFPICDRETVLYYRALNDHPYQDWLVQQGQIVRDPNKITTGLHFADQNGSTIMGRVMEYLTDPARAGYLVPENEVIEIAYGEKYQYRFKYTDEVASRFAGNKSRLTEIRHKFQVRRDKLAEGNPLFYDNQAYSIGVTSSRMRPMETIVMRIFHQQAKIHPEKPVSMTKVLAFIHGENSEYSEKNLSVSGRNLICRLTGKGVQITTVRGKGYFLTPSTLN